MAYDYISKLILEQEISLEVHAGINLRIKDEFFRPGTVRVMLPIPINAPFLHEGQILDFNPMFRMVSVEDYPQRTAYFNERLSENLDFYIEFAFTNSFNYIKPDISLVDSTVQKKFEKEQLSNYYKNHHCGCESYTGLAKDAVSIMDIASEDFISFSEDRFRILTELGIVCGNDCSDIKLSSSYMDKNGSAAYSLYQYLCKTAKTEECFNASSDLAAEYVALCRMCNIPARWMGGLEPDYENKTARPHTWAMIYLAPYGWIYADPTNGCNSELSDFYFGNINPSVIPTASRLGGSMYPAKDYDRADVLYNVSGEVELVPDKMTSNSSSENIGYGLGKDQFVTSFSIFDY